MIRVAIVAVVVMLQVAFACSCRTDLGELSEAVAVNFEHANAIFIGKFIHSTDFQPFYKPGDYVAPTHQVVTFEVQEGFKGVYSGYFTTITYTECCACGSYISLPGIYLIYSSFDGSSYTISTCSRSQKIEEDTEVEDLAILRNLSKKD